MTYGPHTSPQGLLAENWQMSSDGRELSLTLRKGVRIHSGRELTTSDVRETLMRLVTDPAVAGTGFFTQVQPLSDVDVVDPYTIVLKSAAPWPGVFNLLALMSVVDPQSIQTPSGRQQPVGTGPFRFAEWQQGDHIRLTRNPEMTGSRVDPRWTSCTFRFSRTHKRWSPHWRPARLTWP